MVFTTIPPFPTNASGIPVDAIGDSWNAKYLVIDANFLLLEGGSPGEFWQAGGGWAVPAGSGVINGHVIFDEGVAETQRANMDFIGASVKVLNGAGATEVIINGAVWAKNIEALTGNKTLIDDSEPIQVLTPDAARDVNLPAEAVTNPIFIIQNPSGSGFTLTVKDDSPAIIDTVADGEMKIFFSDGVAWDVFSAGGSGDMLASTYDPATIAEQLVGLIAVQTLTNKDVSSGTNTFPGVLTRDDDTDVSANAWVLDEDDLVSDSDTKVPTQQSVKKYVDDIVLPIGFAASDEDTALTTGLAKLTMRMPFAMTLTDVRSNLKAAPTGADLIVDINENGTSILSTKLSIDATEKTSTTATTPAVISDSNLADDAEITIDIDQVGSTISGSGLKLWLIGKKA